MPKYDDPSISNRKDEHLDIVLGKEINYRKSTWFEYIHLVHNSLPELDMEEIDTSIDLFGRRFDYPILIDSMTGGSPRAESINRALARLASKYNIPVSCGSQKAGLVNKDVIYTYRVMRDECSECFIIGNIGGHDLMDDPVGIAEEVISMIDADALAIHLNPLQEAIQHESIVNYRGVIQCIREVKDNIDIPIIIKETGGGISMYVAKILENIGVDAINISGAGGTSWSAVETYRNMLKKNRVMYMVGETFWDWGIPTAASLIEVLCSVDIPIISSGGIRNGIDIVKSIVLGARMAGLAQPFLRAYHNNELDIYIRKLIKEVKIAMFLTGASSIKDLSRVDYVITGELYDWLSWRGLINAVKQGRTIS